MNDRVTTDPYPCRDFVDDSHSWDLRLLYIVMNLLSGLSSQCSRDFDSSTDSHFLLPLAARFRALAVFVRTPAHRFERVLHSVFTSHAILHIRHVASLQPTVSTILEKFYSEEIIVCKGYINLLLAIQLPSNVVRSQRRRRRKHRKRRSTQREMHRKNDSESENGNIQTSEEPGSRVPKREA
ncbi:hypothetical protein PM082_004397 [Marasmius tenuissimus]|nr:hypothetical protein PM082_004397 [Marasmius tenuissimus]